MRLCCRETFKGDDFSQTTTVARFAAEAGCEKYPHQLPGFGDTDDPAAEADQVKIVVLDSLMRGKRFVDQAGAHTGDFVGGDTRTHAAAAKGDASIHLSCGDGTGQWHDKVGIVVIGLQLMIAEINDMVAGFTKFYDQGLFQCKTTVVRRDADPKRFLR